jgi:hypothetical protein
VLIVLKSGSLNLLEPSGPVQGCNEIALHILIISYLLPLSVFVTPSSGRPLPYLLKNYMLIAILLYRLCTADVTALQKAYNVGTSTAMLSLKMV